MTPEVSSAIRKCLEEKSEAHSMYSMNRREEVEGEREEWEGREERKEGGWEKGR